MKNTLFKAILIIAILFTQCFSGIAQTRVYLIDYDLRGLNYKVLLVLNGDISAPESNNYTRTAAYDEQHNYIVVNQTVKFYESGKYGDNKHYTSLKQSDGYFVNDSHGHTFSEGGFTFVYGDEDMFTDPPILGDILHKGITTNFIKKINYDELNYNFLKKFYKDGEQQLTYLESLNPNGNQAANNVIPATTPNVVSNTLVLQNQTRHEISVCFVYWDNGCSCWISRGYRNIPSQESNTINIDGLNIGKNIMYLHADSKWKTWGDNFSFCMNQNGQPLQFADQQNCQNQKLFVQVNLVTGQNTYNFIP